MRQIRLRKRCIFSIQMSPLFPRICKVAPQISALLIAYFDTRQNTLLDGNQSAKCIPAIPSKGINGVCILLQRCYIQYGKRPRAPVLPARHSASTVTSCHRRLGKSISHAEHRKDGAKTKTMSRVLTSSDNR